MKPKLNEVIKMWFENIGKERPKQNSFEIYIDDLNSKRMCLKSIHSFLKHYTKQHKESLLKYISDILVNFYYNYLELTDLKKFDFKVDKGDNSIVIAKIDLYLCLN